MNENLDPTDSDYSGEELEIDKALRPLSFDDFAGQDKILNNEFEILGVPLLLPAISIAAF